MNLSGGIANLVFRAIRYEAQGNSVAAKFIQHDEGGIGSIPSKAAVLLVCDILRVPAPVGSDRESTAARNEILEGVGFTLQPDSNNLAGDPVVRYGPFLKELRLGLERSSLISSNDMAKTEAEKVMNSKTKMKKTDLSVPEILKIMDQNLPKYYRSTTDAYLRIKPPGGVLRLDDFGRFMRSINVDIPDEKLQEMFNVYDKNGNGGLDAWEFIESFGPAINGHVDTTTSLFMGSKSKLREPTKLKTVQLDAEQTKQLIMARLPFHFKSSTKAFLSAKGGVNPRSHTISFKDLKIWVQNLNIIVPDETIRDLFKFLDSDSKGAITCADFIKVFGHAISGENCENISNAEHMSFHNARPEKRMNAALPKHVWTYSEVKKTLRERLGLIHTSTTKAFMKAKRTTSQTMDLADLKRMLMNLNIDPPDEVIRRMFNEMDVDGDGSIQCREFVQSFGGNINGFSGSFETKPDWYHTEMSNLAKIINKIDGVEGEDGDEWLEHEGAEAEEKCAERAGRSESMSAAQEIAFKKRFGLSVRQALNNQKKPTSQVPPLPLKAAPTALQAESIQSGKVEEASSVRSAPPLPPSVSSAPPLPPTPTGRKPQERPHSAGSFCSSSSRRGGADSVAAASTSARSAPTVGRIAFPGPKQKENRVAFRPTSASVTSMSISEESDASQHSRANMVFTETPMRLSSAESSSPPISAVGSPDAADIANFTNDDLIAELRERQIQVPEVADISSNDLIAVLRERQTQQRRQNRPQSAPSRRSSSMSESGDSASSESAQGGRFASFTQAHHAKSTVATKLNQAKKMAAVYQEDEKRRKNGGQRRSGSRTRKSTQVESGYWESNNRVMHSGTFRF